MSATAAQNAVAVVGIDIGKNSFHIVARDDRGAIVLRQKWSRSQVEARFANMPPCLIGMEACVGAHHLSRKLKAFGRDARLMLAKYLRPYSKGQKNDFRDAEAIAEAVQRPTLLRTAGPYIGVIRVGELRTVRLCTSEMLQNRTLRPHEDEVAEIVCGFSPEDQSGALDAAERRFVKAARDYGCTEISARFRVSAIMRLLRRQVKARQKAKRSCGLCCKSSLNRINSPA